MNLSRWIALTFLIICLIYGYTAFFTMDASLPPFMRKALVLPSSFPKVLAVLGIIFSIATLISSKNSLIEFSEDDINYRKLAEYKLFQALGLLILMIVYALTLRPLGFITTTIAFLTASSVLLGERKWHIIIPVAVITAVIIWYLVQQVLGIYLNPLPTFLQD